MNQTDIILYSNHCVLCDALRDRLDEKHIPYTLFINVDAMLQLGFTKMPMLQVAEDKILTYKEALQWLEERT